MKRIKNRTVISALLAATLCGIPQPINANDCTEQLFTIKADRGTKIYELVDQLAEQCDLTLIIKDDEANKRMQARLNRFSLKDASLPEVLNVALNENNLNYTLDGNVLKISYLLTKTFHIDYIGTERTTKSTTKISLASGTGSTDTSGGTGSTDQGDGSVTTSTFNTGESESGIDIVSDDKFNFWSELSEQITNILNRPEDHYKAGAPVINKEAGLVTITGTKKQLDRVESYIKRMMKRMHNQVLIDVKMYAVVLNNGHQKGIDWREIYKLQNFKVSAGRLKTRDESRGDTFTSNYEDHGTGTNGFTKNWTGNSVHSDAGNTYNNTYDSTRNSAATLTSAGDAITRVADSVTRNLNIFSSITMEAEIGTILKFLESQGDVHSVSNPKVLTLNNQAAMITVGKQYFYKIRNVQTLAGTGTGSQAVNEIIDSVFAGILLDITPEISADGTITLKVNPSVSDTINPIYEQDNTKRTMPPDLERRQMSSVVTVKDGAHVILGGLITDKIRTETNKVPLLGDIPVLGYAFKYDEKIDEKIELVIIVTPYLVKPKTQMSLKDLGFARISDSNMTDMP